MRPSRHPPKLRRQSGVAMVIVLMFLVAVISIGIFSARYATMGEGIARNQFDYELARQAAESALRDAERDLLINNDDRPARTGARCKRTLELSIEALFDADCTQGLCVVSEETYKNAVWGGSKEAAEPWWPDDKHGKWNNDGKKPSASSGNCTFTGSVPLGTFTGVPPIGGVAQQPEYLVEQFKRDKKYFYRVTARGFGSSENTQVVLQSYFQPPTRIDGSGT